MSNMEILQGFPRDLQSVADEDELLQSDFVENFMAEEDTEAEKEVDVGTEADAEVNAEGDWEVKAEAEVKEETNMAAKVEGRKKRKTRVFRFAETPVMSTYLLGMTVTTFSHVDTYSNNGVLIRLVEKYNQYRLIKRKMYLVQIRPRARLEERFYTS